ncbi:MAG: hypothetical protein IJY25_00790, partial [Bacilli bacterium]|nr:hypothetical protein [Bacilli bacterium]
IKKEFYITIKYKENGYNSSNTSYNLNLDFNFKAAYNVTYTDITVEDTYPSIILETDTLVVDLGENAPSSIKVLMSEAEITNYTYENGVLTIPNVSGNIEIQKVEEKVTLAQYITNLYSPNSTVTNNSITYKVDTTNGIIDDGLGGTVSSGGNLRYYGASPNNYIDIGDTDASGKIILWRIIGVFETKYTTDSLPCNIDSNSDGHYDNCASEKLVKIIRDESIGSYSWDNKLSGIGSSTSSYGSNNWADSRLMMLLNPPEDTELIVSSSSSIYEYTRGLYWNNGSGTCYSGSSGATTTCDFTSSGLSEVARNKVENVLWNLGGTNSENLYSNGFYSVERGMRVYSGRPTEWVGKIGLMYPSDYGYATDLGSCSETLSGYSSSTCYTNDWLYKSDLTAGQWTISPYNHSSYLVFNVFSLGFGVGGSASYSGGVRPVLYLKSDVSIVGEGTTSEGINYYVVE